MVTKYIATLRAGTAAPEPRQPVPSPRRITTWIMRRPDTLTDTQREQLNRILEACPDLATARDLAHEFSAIARERRGHDLTQADGFIRNLVSALRVRQHDRRVVPEARRGVAAQTGVTPARRLGATIAP
ncbi:hypothetical protein [Streptomyces sp. NPDC058674]|uniref:hypothetical protein n=1 Tax=Streptomyces sp. NPDC058674 TaxID=3346592 RepID=UPI003653AE40